ncbi:ExbD/TolR family protein [Desulfofustis glycolicus]|uniref:Outer membrane transport energization protein ExbD n=1 Tax=Desulfofustis glycolicus DSM 9705 TaxID=1121409 RepID=A0A1M5X1B4_9BACT|nr:biopolymer transporter ExbD [Desulfofustis glycolicus]MCB2215559.1 biopolymer transporter ExbD [Desulfobulbaceae bacterium]SHH93705.1 outer membrane transport energization protein ExbD [Desulfofustis glycolicus DSM 9705]
MLPIATTRRANRSTVELNIAPLIDMVFILLIFFIVTTSFVKETGIDISRPTAATAVSKPKATILVGIDADNRVFFDNREIDIRTVRANVERALAENPEGAVVVVADKGSTTGTTIAVMDGCRQAGADQVSLAAQLPQH